MPKTVSPGVQALRDVVEKVYRELREAKERGEKVGWSSSKFPCELAESFGLHVGYPENQAAGIAANRDGEVMCQAAEDIGLAFQIQDDILDVTSTQEELGKPIHSDEKNNKVTYVSLMGIQAAAGKVKELSDHAVDLLNSLDRENEFLDLLVESLVSRRK